MHKKLSDQFYIEFSDIIPKGAFQKNGIECGSGWFLLIHRLTSELIQLAKQNDATLTIFSIKEGLGKLKYHCQISNYDYSDDNNEAELNDDLDFNRAFPQKVTSRTLLEYYEHKSSHICEWCGKPGHIDQHVALKTDISISLCYQHAIRFMGNRKNPLEEKRKYLKKLDDSIADNQLMKLDKARLLDESF